MKKIILFAFLVIFSLGAFAITPDSKSKSENPAVPDKKENKLSEEEISSLTKRAALMRDMSKSGQTVIVHEQRSGRRYHDGMNRDYHRHGGVYFIGGGSVVLIVILVIILI
jgi:hypothetical protein